MQVVKYCCFAKWQTVKHLSISICDISSGSPLFIVMFCDVISCRQIVVTYYKNRAIAHNGVTSQTCNS